jgi:3-oxoacyl-[acyl-carrier protein] reductase
MALSLYRKGHHLTLLDLDEPGLTSLVQSERLSPARVYARKLDVRDASGWSDVVGETAARFGRIDFMFNIAGFLKPGKVHEVTPEVLATHIDVNAKGLIFACQAGAKQMVRQRAGHIINLASIAGLSHVPGLAAYAASKHAARGFSLSLAHELRPYGVAVSVLCPDAVETPMLTLQETYPEAEMTFGAGRALTLQEVERALERLMRTRELELVLDVPRSGRALGARLANMFPKLTQLVHVQIARQGRKVQARRVASKRV